MKANQFTLLVLMLFISYSVLGQINIKKNTTLNNSEVTNLNDKVIIFKDSNIPEEIKINIKEGTSIMDLKIHCAISSGVLNVKLIDSDGVEIEEFEIKANNDNEKGTSIGEINKFLKEPKPGDWIVKLGLINATGKLKIKINFENDYFINTSGKFTPNDDGENDVLSFETYNISTIIDFNIYNRWGKLIFSSKNLNLGWDGKVKNELQHSGTYYYVVKATTVSGQEVTKNGYVYLEK